MRIWYIQDGEPLPDPDKKNRPWRGAMLTNAFVDKAHEVIWWGSTFNHFNKKHHFNEPKSIELRPGLINRLLHGPGYKCNKSIKRLLHNRIISDSFFKEASNLNFPDIIIVSLPTIEFFEKAINYGKKNNVPVIVDVRDVWPDHYLTLVPQVFRKVLKIMLLHEFRRIRRLMKNVDGIIAISNSYMKWALNYANRRENSMDRVFPMGYSSVETHFERENSGTQTSLCEKYEIDPVKFNIVFFGTIVSSYDFKTIVDAARVLENMGREDIQFIVAGDGDNFKNLKKMVFGQRNVTLTGWLNRSDLFALAEIGTVGLAPYKSDATMSLPNKPFEYMAFGLPLLSSLCGELEMLINDNGIGLQYIAGDEYDLVRQILWLSDNRSEREEMGFRSKELFNDTFQYDKIYPKLVEHIEDVVSRYEN